MNVATSKQTLPADQYVDVKLRKDVLARLLASHALHADDMRCYSAKSKKALKALLLSAAASRLFESDNDTV